MSQIIFFSLTFSIYASEKVNCIQWEAILIQYLFLICSWMWCLLICVYMTGIPSPLSFLITNSEQQNHNPAYLNSNDSDSHLSLISCFLRKEEWRCTFSHIFSHELKQLNSTVVVLHTVSKISPHLHNCHFVISHP